MRKVDANGPLSQFGCITSDRRVGPWTLIHRNNMWVRKGPEGYRTLFGDVVAEVSIGGFGAYAPDGLTEESGHVWGNNNTRSLIDDDEIERLKREMDSTLISFGWQVDDAHPSVLASRSRTFWQRLCSWLRW